MESNDSLLGILRTLRARERGHLAGLLHDGPIQELAAATLELTLAGPATAAAERQVQAAGRSLRRLMDELAPRCAAEQGLTATLSRRTGWLLAAPLAMDLGEGAAGLRPAEVEAVADLVELLLVGAAADGPPARALVAVRADPGLIAVELQLSVTGDPSAAAAWLDRVTAAVRVNGNTELAGHRLRARMELPRLLSVLMELHIVASTGDFGMQVSAHLVAVLLAERLQLLAERDQLLAERDRLRAQAERHRRERERLRAQAERDRLERQLLQSQRLESLGQLAGGVAHDFNNLLAVISNYAAFVSEEVTKDAPEVSWRSVRDDVAQIQRAAERAAEVTHQLLAFARREAVHFRPLNLNDVTRNAENLLTSTLGPHVALKTELAPDLCPVLADPEQIEQVLVNLAINAHDAMPVGGTLLVSTSTADVDAAHPAAAMGLAPGRYACLKVSDTGVGMTKEVAEHAFEPFFTTKAKGEGIGLGLATVYGIVAQAHGHVQIFSEPGLGTSFVILLPATRQDAETEPARAGKPGAGTGEAILVVEDEPAMREVTRRILCRNGYRVTTAASGREALEIAADPERRIDVLLTDMVMPQMLGKEAAERIQVLRPGVKVLFMSGYTQGLLDSEAGVLVEKPFTEQTLLAKLRQVIGG